MTTEEAVVVEVDTYTVTAGAAVVLVSRHQTLSRHDNRLAGCWAVREAGDATVNGRRGRLFDGTVSFDPELDLDAVMPLAVRYAELLNKARTQQRAAAVALDAADDWLLNKAHAEEPATTP